MQVKLLKQSFYIFGYLLEPCIKMSIFLKFGQIVAIENLQKTLDLTTFSFSIRILAISIYSHQKKKALGGMS